MVKFGRPLETENLKINSIQVVVSISGPFGTLKSLDMVLLEPA